MADPNSIDDLAKVGVSAGGGGLVVAITTLIGKFLTANKLDEVNSKLSILIASDARREAEWNRLDAEKRFAALEAKVDALETRCDRVHK